MHLNVLAFKVYKILLLYTLVSVFKGEYDDLHLLVNFYLSFFYMDLSTHRFQVNVFIWLDVK